MYYFKSLLHKLSDLVYHSNGFLFQLANSNIFVTDTNTVDLIRDLNTFGEEQFKEGNYQQSEDRFRTALDVYHKSRSTGGARQIEILSAITGLVRSLEAQGKDADAALVLQQEYPTVIEIITMLKERV